MGYLSRKALPIKRNDAEPLTREDVQYDLLYHIFSDARTVFTSPIRTTPGEPPAKVHFCDLYVNALYKSSKCSKVLKDKMVETPMFAVELAKISLLTNVGRINTTMACSCPSSLWLLLGSLIRVGSLPRDEDCFEDISSSPFTSENGRQRARRSSHQKLSQSSSPAR